MGLCKCPKRIVTNQFCYEHKVNVCEHCIVTNHPKCVVLSYLKWLQDGDYNPICELCSKNLIDEECVRLVCYHVFHWTCLNHYARRLPPTMAPAGYTCPSCSSPMFPSSNLVSPVADVLRKKFETVNWARIGLGLPSLTEEQLIRREFPSEHCSYNSIERSNFKEQKSEETIVHINEQFENVSAFDRKYPDNVPRRLTHALEKKLYFPPEDHDDDKYKRKNESEKFASPFPSCTQRSKYFQFFRKHKYRRYFFVCTFLFIAFFLFMLVLERLGNRVSIVDDPIFDPLLNPNIRVNDANS